MTDTLLGEFNHAGVICKWLKATLPQLHDRIRTLSITELKPSALRRAYAACIHKNRSQFLKEGIQAKIDFAIFNRHALIHLALAASRANLFLLLRKNKVTIS